MGQKPLGPSPTTKTQLNLKGPGADNKILGSSSFLQLNILSMRFRNKKKKYKKEFSENEILATTKTFFGNKNSIIVKVNLRSAPNIASQVDPQLASADDLQVARVIRMVTPRLRNVSGYITQCPDDINQSSLDSSSVQSSKRIK